MGVRRKADIRCQGEAARVIDFIDINNLVPPENYKVNRLTGFLAKLLQVFAGHFADIHVVHNPPADFQKPKTQ